jgi:hypothetical protein
MKYITTPPSLPLTRKIAPFLAVAALLFTGLVAQATPYATSLTNNAGVVSFRLNQTTDTNDLVQVISGGGSVTNVLQTPANDPANVINRGLIVTNLGISGVFKVRIKHVGSGTISVNSPTIAFNSPRGVAVNRNPASPSFGWVYAANSAAGTKGKGMFAYTSDLFDILGQGATAMTGGYTFGGNDLSAPYHVSIAPDDSVLVTDASTTSGNLISMPPTLNSYSYVLKQISAAGAAAVPVGSNNNHGVIMGGVIVGTGANTKLFTIDEDYQRDPSQGTPTENCSAWEYDIGTGPMPWSNAPNRIVLTPFLVGFSGQNEKVEVLGHYLYANQRRSNPPQHSAYICDLNNLPDPSTYGGATPYGMAWASQTESLAEGYSDDVLRDTMTTSVSSDGKYFAAIIAAGSPPGGITAPDGSVFTNVQNDIIVIPMTNGIPNLPARQVFHWGATANGRDLAFDAAHNLYCVSSGLGILQSIDIGESTDVTTGSDGTFVFATPATQVSVTASTPTAYEQGAVPGVFTITRTADDLAAPLNVFYSISGSAKGGANYVTIPGSVTIAAGQTSTNILVTPISDGTADPVLTVNLSILGAGGYSVGFPLSATVVIADNSTPQMRIASISTNIFEGNLNDYAAFTFQRWGDTNITVVLDTTNFAFGGTAVLNTDYYLTNLPYTVGPGVISATFPLIYPKKASTAVGSLSILLTNRAGSNFTVSNNTAATTITLEAAPPGTVLYSDDFENDPVGTNWNVLFQSYTNGSSDYSVIFGYDYTSGSVGNLLPIPPAPHSTTDTKGLYMTVNKNAGVSAGLNLYLKNHTFSGNYALRFDLFLVENSSGTAQSQVEDVLFGINHDGTHTNWFRNAATGTSLPATPTASDGLFFDIGSDGNGGGGAPYDFAAWSGPTWTNTVNVVGPTNFLARNASTTRDIFKRPPFDSGNALGGDPANQVTFSGFKSPSWVEVEVSQIGTGLGNLISYKIDNTVVMSYFNTNGGISGIVAPNYTSGTVMVGYCDPWDDLANGSAGSGEAAAIIDNLRVVQLSAPVINPQPSNTLANLGGSATFVIGASTATTITNYQWYTNGVAVDGATGPSLTVNPVVASSYATYTVSVSDGAYTVWSTNATLRPVSGPAIITGPTSRAAVVGTSPSFSVTASTGSGATNYQWRYYATNLSGATANTLTLTNVQPVSFGGPYTVVVGDGFTSVTSSPAATLTFAASPSIASPRVPGGNSFAFSYNSEVGPAYVVEFKTSLAPGAWTPLVTNIGTGSIINVTNNFPSGLGPQRFYRVRLQ